VPGVTVNVKSPNSISAQSATTDDGGRFKILNLPPGRYSVEIEANKGFSKFEKTDVEVNLSRTASVEIQLQPQGAQANVTITDTSGAAVDVSANTTGTSVSTEQFSNLPTQRTVQSLYTIAPTVARSGLRDASGRDRDPSVAGSSGPENNYILDGVNTTDPAFGGSGANLPFEFVQEVEIKTGAYGAEYGRATGGIFNVITKSGGNEFHGDAFGYFTTKGLVRETKQFPFTGSAPNGFSEIDAGVDIGGPIKKDKIWFFGAFNPQQRKNSFITQTFHKDVENKITTPFYSGKVTWAISPKHTFTFSTFGDFTKQTGFLFGGSGFGADPNTFQGEIQTGGHNYAARLNSTFNPNWIGEFAFGLHLQRSNILPLSSVLGTPLITDSFAILNPAGAIAAVTTTNVVNSNCNNTPVASGDPALPPPNPTSQPVCTGNPGFVDFVQSAGTLQRNFLRQGFGLFQNQDRNRREIQARMQNIWGRHTLKYGFEYNDNIYNINQASTGPSQTFSDPLHLIPAGSAINNVNGYRTTNSFAVCTQRSAQIVCPSASSTNILFNAVAAGAIPGATSVVTNTITTDEALNHPFLVRTATSLRDFQLHAETDSRVESFYLQDDYRLTNNFQVNFGVRWDYQQSIGNNGVNYLKLDNFMDNAQPRLGVIWDFTGQGRGKLFVNMARFLETPASARR
jgi:outer membrane receptor protein involved in Fe transport